MGVTNRYTPLLFIIHVFICLTFRLVNDTFPFVPTLLADKYYLENIVILSSCQLVKMNWTMIL